MVGRITDTEGVMIHCYLCGENINFRGDIMNRRISCPRCTGSISMRLTYERCLRILGRDAVKDVLARAFDKECDLYE